MDAQIKPRELKFAPAWKRVLSYLIDTVFLFTFFFLLILAAYGSDFSTLYAMVKETGGMNLITKEGLFPEIAGALSTYPKDMQDILYMQHFISNRYYYLFSIYFNILTMGYFAFFWRFTGQTLGARVMGIRVIAKDASILGIGACLLRSVLLRLFEYAYFIPALIIADKRFYQRVHDKLSGTLVIENKEWEETLQELQKILDSEDKLHQDPGA